MGLITIIIIYNLYNLYVDRLLQKKVKIISLQKFFPNSAHTLFGISGVGLGNGYRMMIFKFLSDSGVAP